MTTTEWAEKHLQKAKKRWLTEDTEETKINYERWQTVVSALKEAEND